MKNGFQQSRLVVLLTVLCFSAACTNEATDFNIDKDTIVADTIASSGNGTWVCTLAGAGMMSQCVRREVASN
jgi:hypothetical protein